MMRRSSRFSTRDRRLERGRAADRPAAGGFATLPRVALTDDVCKDRSGGYSPRAIGESPLSRRFRMPM